MVNYSKIYLEVNKRLNPVECSMKEMREQDKSDLIDYKGHIFYIPRDAKMNGV